MTASVSKAVEIFRQLSPEERQKLIESLSPEEAQALYYDWQFWARPNQLPPPGDWLTWLILSGRGWGKTRSAAEFVRMMVESNTWGRIALLAPTVQIFRDIMIEGDSGLLEISPPHFRPLYEPSKRKLTWPNGAVAYGFSSDEPDRLRGTQNHGAWVEEVASLIYPDECWDMLMLGLRLGLHPRLVATTTPKPINLVRKLVQSDSTHVTKGNTYENSANLAPTFLTQIRETYEGTRLGRQEIYAEILDDAPGALWSRGIIRANRVKTLPSMKKVAIGVDPSLSGGDRADETGIVVAGKGVDDHLYTIADLSLREHPDRWARVVIEAYYQYDAAYLVVEVNAGGDLVKTLIHSIDPDVQIKTVRASKGKATRAEPVAALAEQGKAHHLGEFPHLEDQLCSYIPGETKRSPDRMDAYVWVGTDLMLKHRRRFRPR